MKASDEINKPAAFDSRLPQAPAAQELAKDVSRRVLEDDGLRPGDVVSTNRGLFRFQGAPDRERKPDDFVRIR